MVYYSRFHLNSYANMPYFRAQVPDGYPVNLVLQRARRFRNLPPSLKKLAALAKRWAQRQYPEYPAGQRDIHLYYDDRGNELDPLTGRQLTESEVDALWGPPDPQLAQLSAGDAPEPPGGFADPDTWEEPEPEPVEAGHPTRSHLVAAIKARGYERVSKDYGIPVEDLPHGVKVPVRDPVKEPRVGDVDADGWEVAAIATGELYGQPPPVEGDEDEDEED